MAKRESITRSEYLQLLGLRLIAKQHYNAIQEAAKAAHRILGTSEDAITGDDGWVGDTFWGDDSEVDHMLKMMKVAVEDNVDANT